MPLRLISLNAWGGRIIGPLLDYLREVNADIVCLQEVTRALEASPERLLFKGHGQDLPQHADLFAAVAEVLRGHDAMFCPAMQGVLFDAAGRTYGSRFGLATFVRREIAVLGQAVDFVHGTYGSEEWGEPPVPRNMHALHLMHPATKRPFVVAHFHGLRELSGKEDTPGRAAQAERVLEVLGRVRGGGEPAIVCGDFNLLPESETFARLAQVGLCDLVTARGFTDTRTSFYEKAPRFADYLLVTQGVRVAHFDVASAPEVSDHRPLVLDFD